MAIADDLAESVKDGAHQLEINGKDETTRRDYLKKGSHGPEYYPLVGSYLSFDHHVPCTAYPKNPVGTTVNARGVRARVESPSASATEKGGIRRVNTISIGLGTAGFCSKGAR